MKLDQGPMDQNAYIAVLQAEGRALRLVVDRVLNTEEIVVKPADRAAQGHRPLRGRDDPR